MFLVQGLYAFGKDMFVSLLETLLLIVQKWQDMLHMQVAESLKKTSA